MNDEQFYVPQMFSDTVLTDHQSDTTFSSSEHTGSGYPGLMNKENLSDMCRCWESNPDFMRERQTPYPLG